MNANGGLSLSEGPRRAVARQDTIVSESCYEGISLMSGREAVHRVPDSLRGDSEAKLVGGVMDMLGSRRARPVGMTIALTPAWLWRRERLFRSQHHARDLDQFPVLITGQLL